MLFVCLQLWAQDRTVTGTVLDAKGNPAADVSVQVKGTNLGTVTNAQGRYSVNVPSTARTLVFSSVNALSQEIEIGRDNVVNVTMASTETSLQEVVVVGYGTQRRREITGNVSTVRGAEVAQKPVQSFEQALGGRAAGVQITVPNGVLNNPPVFRIRGTNSISLSSYPLIVIDGVPAFTGNYSSANAPANPLASINPNDIESIDIAKDAAATAIYGSRAANGVVFITTKRGKAGKTKVNYDGWVGWTAPFRLPEMLDAFQYTDIKNEALRNANLYDDSNPVAGNRRYFALMNGPDGQPINTNWYDYAYRTGIAHNHAISLSGANESTNYYFGAGYTDQQGMIRRNDFVRRNVLFNMDSRLNKVLTVGGKISFSNELNKAASQTGSINPTGTSADEAFSVAGLGRNVLVASPNVSPYNNDGTYNIGGQYVGVGGNVGIPQVGFFNIAPIIDLNRSNSENNHIQGNVFLQLKPLPWMTLRTLYGIDNIHIDNDVFWNPIHGDGQSYTGYATASYGKYKTWLWSNTAQLDHTFGDKHSLSLLVGNEQQRRTTESFGINRQTLSDPAFNLIQAGFTTNNSNGMSYGENYLLSSFSRLNYDFAKKYFLSANIRQDEYSALGKKKGIFWGVSAGWDLTQETFWENSGLANILNSFRLRGSYGKVGNINGVTNYASFSTYVSGMYGGNATLALSTIGNPELTWETSTKTDVGFTFGALNDRISGEVAYFKNDINNLILNVSQAPSTGLTTIASNVGTMYNKGIELTLNATPVQAKDFSWTTSFNYTRIKNEVTSLAPGLAEITFSTAGTELTNKTLPGYPMGYLFVVRTGGVDPATGRRIFYNNEGNPVLYQNYVAPGSGGFNWSNPDGTQHRPISQSADGVLYANTLPKSYGGWDNTFRYKGFELNTLLTYQTGFYIYYGTNAGLLDQRYWNNSTDVLNRWQKPGDVATVPKVYYNDNVSNGSTMPISNNVFRGDFLKLRSMTLGYTLPTALTARVRMSGARVYVSGQNLAVLTDYPGPDPETSGNGGANNGQGVDRNQVGNARTVTVGLNLTF